MDNNPFEKIKRALATKQPPVAKSVDAPDLKSEAVRRVGSTPTGGTNIAEQEQALRAATKVFGSIYAAQKSVPIASPLANIPEPTPYARLVARGYTPCPSCEWVNGWVTQYCPSHAKISPYLTPRKRESWDEKIIAGAKSLAHTIHVKLFGLFHKELEPHSLDTMTPKRYNELNLNPNKALTAAEIANGYRYCCEWDGLLIHATHPEADCCACLKEYREQNNIKDSDWRDK